MEQLLKEWERATGELKPGVQRAFLDVLTLAAEGKITVAWGKDYYNGKPCLVNAVAQMLSTGGGSGVPINKFPTVVNLFDNINAEMYHKVLGPQRSTQNIVDPLTAEILVRNFGELKPMPVGVQFDEFAEREFVEALDVNRECPVDVANEFAESLKNNNGNNT